MHTKKSILFNRSPALLTVACATILSHYAGAQGFDITTADAYDQEFDPADWEVVLATTNQIPSAGTFTQELTGGNPDAHGVLAMPQQTAPSIDPDVTAVVYRPYSFNPACEGTLESVVLRYDQELQVTPSGVALAVEQGGSVMLREAGGASGFPGWVTRPANTITVAQLNVNSISFNTGSLDASGGPVRFGIANYGTPQTSPFLAPIDNWSVVINTTGGTPEYNVGGSVTGLAGSVTLQNNGGDDLVLSADGAFTGFSTGMTCGAAYNVTVAAQPTGQLCTVSNGAGSVADPTPADISDVSVSCVTATPELILVTAITAGDPYAAAGDSVSYSYTVTNSGNVALAGPVSITDDTVTGVSCPAVTTVGNNDANLDPSEVLVCSGTYTVTQADVDAGSLTNSATASADGTTSAASGATGTAAPPPPAAPATPVPVAGLWALILTTLSVVFMGGVASRRRAAR